MKRFKSTKGKKQSPPPRTSKGPSKVVKGRKRKKENSIKNGTVKVVKILQKAFGVDGAQLLSKMKGTGEILPTHNVSFDFGLLGIGGLPSRNVMEIFGSDKVGKSTLLKLFMVAYQREGYTIAIVDQKADIAADVERVQRIGVDPDGVVVLPLRTTDESIEAMRETLSAFKANNLKCALFWDDMGLSATKDSVDKSVVGDDNPKVAEAAKLSWRMCRELQPVCYRQGIPFIIVNQVIQNIGGYGMATTGGGSVRYAARIRFKLSLHKGGAVIVAGKQTGQLVDIETVANVFYSPKRKVILHLDYIDGYDDMKSLVQNAVTKKVLKKSRGRFSDVGGSFGEKDKTYTPEQLAPYRQELLEMTWPEVFGKKEVEEEDEDDDIEEENFFLDD